MAVPIKWCVGVSLLFKTYKPASVELIMLFREHGSCTINGSKSPSSHTSGVISLDADPVKYFSRLKWALKKSYSRMSGKMTIIQPHQPSRHEPCWLLEKVLCCGIYIGKRNFIDFLSLVWLVKWRHEKRMFKNDLTKVCVYVPVQG